MNDAPVKKRIVNMSEYRTCPDDCQLETLLKTYQSYWLQNPLWLVNASTRIPNPRHYPKEAQTVAQMMISTDEPDTIDTGSPYSDFVFMPMSAQAEGMIAA